MKQTQNKMKLFLYICLGLIILNACTFEEEIIKQNGYQEKMKLESKKFSELLKLPAFNNAYKRVINKKVTLSNDLAARTALEDQYGFIIVENKDVKIITDIDGSIYYSMLIERAIIENLKFENLIIKVKDDDVVAVILKYELNEKATYFQEHDSYDFDIKETIMQPLEIEGNTSELRNTVTIVTIFSHCTKPFGDPKYCGGDYSSPFWSPACSHLEYSTVVLNSGIGGGTGSGWNPSNDGGSGPVINNGPSVNTAPIVDDEDVLVGSTPCDKLYDLIKPYPLGQQNPYKEVLQETQDAVGGYSFEVGHIIKFNGNYLNLHLTEIYNSIPSNCDGLHLGPLTHPYLFGFFHSHPSNCGNNGLGEMFSHADITSFCKIVKNHNNGNATYPNGTSVNPDNFIITVASTYGTFAIKINDFETFRNKAIEILSSQKNYDKFKEKYNDGVPHMFENEEKKTVGLLKTLNSMFNNSLSVYKAQPEFTGWDKLELTDNNTKSKKTPCN